jgi:L-lysine 6-transaminase
MMNYSKSQKYLEEFRKYVIMEPYPFVVDLKNSKGMWLATVDGEMLFDWTGYYGSKLLGHNHPGLFEPDYLQNLIYAANNKVANPDFLTVECIEYYRKIYEYAPECMRSENLEVYAVNSGAEAVENLAKYFINLYDKKMNEKGLSIGTRRIIYFDQAFHGRTIFALNMTRLKHAPKITRNFKDLIIGNIQVPFPVVDRSKSDEENKAYTNYCLQHIKEIINQYKEEVVGIIVEPIQGAGGQRMAYPEFFRELSRIAHDNDIYLGFDEVQTAGGQTGTFFMIDSFNLPYPPQGVATGKKMANGVVYMLNPMIDLGILDSTWGGNLADMVRFVQEMKIVEREKLMEQLPEKTKLLLDGLSVLESGYNELIYNVRGAGLYQGFSLRDPKKLQKLVDYALNTERLLLLEAGTDTIRFRPMLDVTPDEINLMLEKLENCLKYLESEC